MSSEVNECGPPLPPGRMIALEVAYDGTDFSGWQVQPGVRTVEGTLEEALGQIEGSPVDVQGASRTDQGVHALGQGVSYRSRSPIPPERVARVLNGRLPRDVRVVSSREAPPGFNARLSAVGKAYAYVVDRREVPGVLCSRYAFHFPEVRALGPVREAAQLLVGEHDFASFQCESGQPRLSTVRRVDGIFVLEEGPLLVIEVWGVGFLYKMVRTIAGTLLEVARGRWSPARVARALEARDRGLAGPTAPPEGLVLRKVFFESGAYAGGVACRGGGQNPWCPDAKDSPEARGLGLSLI